MHHEAKDRDPVWDCTLIENMRKNKDVTVNPIYEWTDDDVWTFARDRQIEMNPLYSMGYCRVGCIGCPLASPQERMKEFQDFPTYRTTFIKVFDKILKIRMEQNADESRRRRRRKPSNWKNGETMFNWWIENNDTVEGQIEIEEWLNS